MVRKYGLLQYGSAFCAVFLMVIFTMYPYPVMKSMLGILLVGSLYGVSEFIFRRCERLQQAVDQQETYIESLRERITCLTSNDNLPSPSSTADDLTDCFLNSVEFFDGAETSIIPPEELQVHAIRDSQRIHNPFVECVNCGNRTLLNDLVSNSDSDIVEWNCPLCQTKASYDLKD